MSTPKEMDAALEAAGLGGQILRRHFTSPNVRSKGYRDIVTDADYECERTLREFFAERFPDYGFIGEEGEKKYLKHGRNWVVDPLDGTREFSLGIPYFSVSVALIEEKKVLAGVVHNPMLEDFYSAEAGKGAQKNGNKISCAGKSSLNEALSTGCFVYSRPELAKFAYANKIFVMNYSPALDLCGVASGRSDSTVYTFSTLDDHSAGALIVQEAGGVVSNFGRPDFDPFASGVMASNPVLHRQLVKLFPEPFEEVSYEESQYEETYAEHQPDAEAGKKRDI